MVAVCTVLSFCCSLETPVGVGRKSGTSKVLVVLAVELLRPKGFGRIHMRRICRRTTQSHL